MLYEAKMPRHILVIASFFMDNCESKEKLTRKRIMLNSEAMGQCDPSVFLGITVQGIKSEKAFAPNLAWIKYA